MKLYIDGLFYKGSGIGRYYESLTKEFAKRGIKIYTCVPKRLRDDFEKDFKDVADNIEPIFVDYEKFSIKGLFEQSKILKKLESGVDLFFYPHVNLPFYIPKNTIVTIHDLIPLTSFWDRSEIKRKIFIFYLKRAITKSKGIITISHIIENELKKYFRNLQNKVNVIYEFIDDKFYTPKFDPNPIIKDDYILFVGNRKKHKNLTNLILAFDKIKDKVKIKLVIAGSKDNKNTEDEIDLLIKNLNLKDYIIEVLSPSDNKLINLYQHAKLFVFPSLFEGFGLPPLEAIALGCPVITSNIPVLKEILEENIACFDPYNVDDIAEKLLQALTNEDLRFQLLNEGRGRLKFFDKDEIINEFFEYFNNYLGT
ncbi:MAG: glycosyltransferase family 4 protein [Thermovenabulum sp.]|uniref:glycosyltransferase family 4 protein n=1 Tax=Thermovenabulum sp. TaxID=3100335 RepID=UPI003C7D50E6